MRYLIPALAALLVAWSPGVRLVQLVLAVGTLNIALWIAHRYPKREVEA